MVARRIAEALGEDAVSITDVLRGTRRIMPPDPGEKFGLVCPVYFFGLPAPVEDFISMLEPLEASHYIYGVITYGNMTGMASAVMRRLLALRGLHMDATFSVRMVDVWTPMFNLSDSAACLRRTEKAIPKVDNIIARIRSEARATNPSLPACFAPFGRKVYDDARTTRHFHLLGDRCIGCGLCSRGCPAEAITLDADQRPEWTTPQCTLCLRCLHRCPTFAIQYGTHTASHGQFINPFINPNSLK